jgi:nicotinamidase/pyrazinamidase
MNPQYDNILFWNVDSQVDFMLPNGKLYVKDAEKILPTLYKITNTARLAGIRVVNTMDDHLPTTEELADNPADADFVKTFPPHCMRNSFGQMYVDETNPFLFQKEIGDVLIFPWDTEMPNYIVGKKISEYRNIIITKDEFDVFTGNKNTDKILSLLTRDLTIKEIYVYGVATNVCVNFAVMGLLERGYDVVVISDAMKGLPNVPDVIPNWIDVAKKLNRQLNFTTSNKIINEL